MLSKFLLSLSFVCLVLVGALTISCGSSGAKPCTGGPYNVVGDWQITASSTAGAVTGYGAIDSAGLALFFDNVLPNTSGDTLQLPTLTGTCAFSGNVTSYGELGGPNSGIEVEDTMTGNVNSATSITGSFNGTGGSGTISAAPFTPLSGAVATVSGGKTGVIIQGPLSGQPVLLPLTFAAGGSANFMIMNFTTTNLAGCEASGTFTEVGSSDELETLNVFDVSITLMPTCPIIGTFTGIGFESSTDYFGLNPGGNPDTYLYADILDGTNTFVIEFY
ncbi:MAG: hypothetical protein ACLPHP_09555 [Candidatus Sulfotelmatobacter sp.]